MKKQKTYAKIVHELFVELSGSWTAVLGFAFFVLFTTLKVLEFFELLVMEFGTK